MTTELTQTRVLDELIDSNPEAFGDLAFTLLDIGALPIEGQHEPYHRLPELFPGSRIISVEVDEDVCKRLNAEALPGQEFYPAALGRKEETRRFYRTAEPMCSSLYPPNEALISRYHNMEPAMLDSVTTIETVSLDRFAARHGIDDVDFIKIDIQGAELDVFEGGAATLTNVTAIVSEVEFIPHYVGQPLFGHVCAFLMQRGFMFHKFLGMAGRALRPVVMNNDKNSASQHIWTDALFIRDILRLHELPAQKLLKMAVLSLLYGSPDVACSCLHAADEQLGTGTAMTFLQAGRKSGASKSGWRKWSTFLRR